MVIPPLVVPPSHTAKATPFHPWKIAINHLSGSIWSYVNQEFSLSVLDVPCLEGSAPNNQAPCNNKRRDVRRHSYTEQYTYTISFEGYCWIILERCLSLTCNDSSDLSVICIVIDCHHGCGGIVWKDRDSHQLENGLMQNNRCNNYEN